MHDLSPQEKRKIVISIHRAARIVLISTLLLAGRAFGQDVGRETEKEPAAIVELGAAGQWALTHGVPSYGPSVAVETTPIQEWLEIEAGVTPFFSRGQTEWDTDLLFKKPYTLSRTTEFMFGVGPEWAHTVTRSSRADTFGVEAALDFMLWPWPKRRFGWYAEPSYSFSDGHKQSASVTAGLLIAVPKRLLLAGEWPPNPLPAPARTLVKRHAGIAPDPTSSAIHHGTGSAAHCLCDNVVRTSSVDGTEGSE